MQNYKPDTEYFGNHLDLSIGDVIAVFGKEGDTWRGKLGRLEGWFPKTYVEDKPIKSMFFIRYRLKMYPSPGSICLSNLMQ